MPHSTLWQLLILGLFVWLPAFSAPAEEAQEKDETLVSLMVARQEELAALLERIRIEYSYQGRYLPGTEKYNRRLIEEGTSKPTDTSEVTSLNCSLALGGPDKFAYKVETKDGASLVHYMRNGALMWVHDERQNVANIVSSMTPNPFFATDLLSAFPGWFSSGLIAQEKSFADLVEIGAPEIRRDSKTPSRLTFRFSKPAPPMPGFPDAVNIWEVEVDAAKAMMPVAYRQIVRIGNTEMPPRIEVRYGGGKLVGGLYLPEEIWATFRTHVAAPPQKTDAQPPSGDQYVTYDMQQVVIKVSKFEVITPKDDELFTFRLPKGTGVNDRISGEQYQVGEPVEVIADEVDRIKEGSK